MRSANYAGRVGALAVALGIGGRDGRDTLGGVCQAARSRFALVVGFSIESLHRTLIDSNKLNAPG